MNDRSSVADNPQLVSDPREIARVEAANTLRQFDDSMSELARWISHPGYTLRVSTILRFNRQALHGLSASAGTFRTGGMSISGSRHVPPPPERVPELMEEFCDYVHSNWMARSAVHLSAYALWRLNWIHPFVDGNGRTARTVSYLILCAKLGYRLPGDRTIPEQIAADKKPYYHGLELGDQAADRGAVDVTGLEKLLEEHLAHQLVAVYHTATGDDGKRNATTVVPPSKTPSTGSENMPPVSPERHWLVGHLESHPVIYGGLVVLLAGLLSIIFQG